jgi:hypothetical protein
MTYEVTLSIITKITVEAESHRGAEQIALAAHDNARIVQVQEVAGADR